MELGRIVAGIDFGSASAAAATWVARHFAPDAELHLVHALDLPQPPQFLRALLPAPAELEETARKGAEERLRELAASLDPARVHTVIRCGRPDEVVAAYAHEIGADLLVIGEHGERRTWLGLPGTTAERILHTADVPVLVVRRPHHAPPTRVIVPVDASEAAEDVFDPCRLLVRSFDAELTVFYAVSPMLYGRMRNVSGMARERRLEDELVAQGEAWLDERLSRTGLRDAASIEVAIGDPRTEIPALAERADADLIVMASRGPGAVGRAMIGSVAAAVLRTAACPVLVVPGGAGGAKTSD